MKTTINLAAIGALLTLGIGHMNAQTTTNFQTNITFNAKISLTAYSQVLSLLSTNANDTNFVRSVHITKLATAYFVAAIGAGIGQGTNIFSDKAKLLLKIHEEGTTNK